MENVGNLNKLKGENEMNAMSRRSDIGNWPEPGKRISRAELKELIKYGENNNIDVISFENYDGEIGLIKSFIDSIVEVANDYPEILSGKRNLQLRCSYRMNAGDYAETTNNCIIINGNAFRSEKALKEDYENTQNDNDPYFVEGTTHKNIAHHELGHIIVQKFKISSKRIVKGVNLDEVSVYGSRNPDEAIAESISAHYVNKHNAATLKIKSNCDKIIKERRAIK